MPIETLDDIVEHLADLLGFYGAHDDREKQMCRICFTSELRVRIEKAVEVEDALERGHKRVARYGEGE